MIALFTLLLIILEKIEYVLELVMWIRTGERREVKDLDDMVVLVEGVAVGAESSARAIQAVEITFILGQFSVHRA
jgi:hypothetical protein